MDQLDSDFAAGPVKEEEIAGRVDDSEEEEEEEEEEAAAADAVSTGSSQANFAEPFQNNTPDHRFISSDDPAPATPAVKAPRKQKQPVKRPAAATAAAGKKGGEGKKKRTAKPPTRPQTDYDESEEDDRAIARWYLKGSKLFKKV